MSKSAQKQLPKRVLLRQVYQKFLGKLKEAKEKVTFDEFKWMSKNWRYGKFRNELERMWFGNFRGIAPIVKSGHSSSACRAYSFKMHKSVDKNYKQKPHKGKH